MTVQVKRLMPGQDLLAEIEALVHGLQIRGGVLLSIVGSLTEAAIRFADQEKAQIVKGPVEIVSGTGTVCDSGSHIHLAVADAQGQTTGGHLMYGCKVYTTVELVILDFSGEWIFERQKCSVTGYQELRAERVDNRK